MAEQEPVQSTVLPVVESPDEDVGGADDLSSSRALASAPPTTAASTNATDFKEMVPPDNLALVSPGKKRRRHKNNNWCAIPHFICFCLCHGVTLCIVSESYRPHAPPNSNAHLCPHLHPLPALRSARARHRDLSICIPEKEKLQVRETVMP